MARWHSVQVRTTVLATVVVAVSLSAGSVLLLATLGRTLRTNQDEMSQSLARSLAHDVATDTLSTPLPVGEDAMAQVVTADGTVLAASAGLGAHGPVSEVVARQGELEAVHLTGVPDDDELETYQAWTLAAESSDGPVRIYVGVSPERVDEAVAALRAGLSVGVPVLVALLAGSTYLLVGRALRPVEAITVDVAQISAARLQRRVPVPDTDDEIERLALTMNAMLERLDDAHRRQREFVGDASHELLSPLASLRAQLEIAVATPDTTQWPELAADLLRDGDRMERLVRDLLFLAREDDPSLVERTATALLDLDTLVLEEARRLRPPAGITVDTTAVSAAPVRGRSEELTRMVRNVLENAAGYASHRVVVELGVTGGWVELAVSDDGPGVPDGMQERVFERFVRAEPDRSRTRGGGGLGLPIARSIARRHGGDIVLDTTAFGTRVRITLPADPTH